VLVGQKLAIAAHLHVLLRRKTGRVTDTEWMAENLEYALEIVRFTRSKAAEDGHADLIEWADKLERAVLEPSPAKRAPLTQSAMQLIKERNASTPAQPGTNDAGQSTFGDTGFADSGPEGGKPPKPRDPSAPRYVGGIR
jgi:hypothetical protein